MLAATWPQSKPGAPARGAGGAKDADGAGCRALALTTPARELAPAGAAPAAPPLLAAPDDAETDDAAISAGAEAPASPVLAATPAQPSEGGDATAPALQPGPPAGAGAAAPRTHKDIAGFEVVLERKDGARWLRAMDSSLACAARCREEAASLPPGARKDKLLRQAAYRECYPKCVVSETERYLGRTVAPGEDEAGGAVKATPPAAPAATKKKLIFPRPDLKALHGFNVPKPVAGAVPGVDVGDTFYSQAECRLGGVHHEVQRGIACAPAPGADAGEDAASERARKAKKKGAHAHIVKYVAVSIVVSGGYADDEHSADFSTFSYTGAGGNDIRGDKQQHADQSVELRDNAALVVAAQTARHAVRVLVKVKEQGYLPTPGMLIYIGLYRVTQHGMVQGASGYKVFKCKLERVAGQAALSAETLALLAKASKASAERASAQQKRAAAAERCSDDEDADEEKPAGKRSRKPTPAAAARGSEDDAQYLHGALLARSLLQVALRALGQVADGIPEGRWQQALAWQRPEQVDLLLKHRAAWAGLTAAELVAAATKAHAAGVAAGVGKAADDAAAKALHDVIVAACAGGASGSGAKPAAPARARPAAAQPARKPPDKAAAAASADVSLAQLSADVLRALAQALNANSYGDKKMLLAAVRAAAPQRVSEAALAGAARAGVKAARAAKDDSWPAHIKAAIAAASPGAAAGPWLQAVKPPRKQPRAESSDDEAADESESDSEGGAGGAAACDDDYELDSPSESSDDDDDEESDEEEWFSLRRSGRGSGVRRDATRAAAQLRRSARARRALSRSASPSSSPSPSPPPEKKRRRTAATAPPPPPLLSPAAKKKATAPKHAAAAAPAVPQRSRAAAAALRTAAVAKPAAAAAAPAAAPAATAAVVPAAVKPEQPPHAAAAPAVKLEQPPQRVKLPPMPSPPGLWPACKRMFALVTQHHAAMQLSDLESDRLLISFRPACEPQPGDTPALAAARRAAGDAKNARAADALDSASALAAAFEHAPATFALKLRDVVLKPMGFFDEM